MKTKTVTLLTARMGSYLAIILFHSHLPVGRQIVLFVIFSFSGVGIWFCVMHDANHGAYSSSKTVNKLLWYSMNMLGYNKWVWTQQHNLRHHVLTNIDGHDDDIQPWFALRFAKEQPHHRRHQFQRLYFLPLYALQTVIWVVVGDFMKFYTYTQEAFKNRATDKVKHKQYIKESRILYLSKARYFILIFGIPLLAGFDIRLIVKAFFIMHAISGLFTALVFQCAHVRVDAETYDQSGPEKVDENSFVVHQVQSTGNFAPQSRIFSRFIGGLTHQIEHHLFPNICHVHYPKIRPIVRQTLLEYGLPYNEYKTFASALRSHAAQIRQLSWKPKSMA